MRILIYGINYAPELTGIGKYTTEMCEYLVECGHEVTMVTAFPYYPEWKVCEKYIKRAFLKEDYNGVNVKRSWLYMPSNINAKSRILHEMSFIVTSFFNLISSKKPDLLITISPPLGLGLTAYLFSRFKRVRSIFHVQDLQPDTAVDLGMIKKGALIRFLYRIEKFIYGKASLVSTISEGMRKKILEKGIDSKKVLLLPNWVDTDFIRPLGRDNIFRKDNDLLGKFLVLYSGSIGVKQGLDTILDVAEMTRNSNEIVYLIVGNGSYRDSLIERHKKMGLPNVRFLPVQPKDILPYMLSAADISLIPQQKTVTDIVMPSKLTGILASGRPAIVGAKPGSQVYKVIKNNDCGIAVEPENAEQMFKAVMNLYNNRVKAEEFGKNGREYALENLSKESILKAFEEKICNSAAD